MKITKIYHDQDGESHFEEIEVDLHKVGLGQRSSPIPVQSLIFRETPGPYSQGWHCAPEIQYVILLSGEVQVEVSDGTCKKFTAGDILLAADTKGKGHKTSTLSSGIRHSLFIPVNKLT